MYESVPRLGLFMLCSAVFFYLSRKSLSKPHSHGFARFFAWEAILALFLINVPYWFEDRFSPKQLLSWLLLFCSLYLLVHGAYLLQVAGKPGPVRDGEELFGFEKTSVLVQNGIYRYIRHPLYASLLFLAWGIFLKLPTWIGGLLSVSASLLLWITAKHDESECVDFFGDEYRNYMSGTRMFIPFLF